MSPILILAGAFGIGLVIILVGLAVRARDRKLAARQAEVAAAEAAEKRREEEQERAAKRAAEQEAAASASAQSSTMTRAGRDNWIRQCVQKLGCKQWQVDTIIEGAPPGPEHERALRVSLAAAAQDIAREHGRDGPELSAVPAGIIAGMVARENAGLALLELMPHTTMAEAKKDPDAGRGSAIRASGSVIEIARAARSSRAR